MEAVNAIYWRGIQTLRLHIVECAPQDRPKCQEPKRKRSVFVFLKLNILHLKHKARQGTTERCWLSATSMPAGPAGRPLGGLRPTRSRGRCSRCSVQWRSAAERLWPPPAALTLKGKQINSGSWMLTRQKPPSNLSCKSHVNPEGKFRRKLWFREAFSRNVKDDS